MPSESGPLDHRELSGAADDTILTLTPDPPRECRVLVVDDDELIRFRLSALLRAAGCEVYTAASGEEALRVLESHFCQIVLTDWHMPDMDGLALCRHLRAMVGQGYIYVMMLTVRDGRSDVVSGLSAGADDYVVKGASSEEILARLEVAKRITHLEHSLRASNRENRRMSVTDALTGALNRRYLMKYLPRELDRAVRYKHPIAVVSFDVDHFKRINDDFGHGTGDEVLHEIVRRSQVVIRDGIDWIARSGGEEFVVVLPETNLKQALHFSERLRSSIAGRQIITVAGRLDVSISIGATALEEPLEFGRTTASDLLRAADQCVYASKSAGRDRATGALPAHSKAVLSASRQKAGGAGSGSA
jgi:two-component system, cell cycle response regulator